MPAGPALDITTRRLMLRVVRPADAEAVLAGRTPAGLRLAEGYPSQFSLDLVSVAIEGSSTREIGPFFVIRRADRAVVGEIGCRLDGPRTTAHVGYTIVESCWNRGYASEALAGLIDHLLHVGCVPRVEAETLATHVASRRVMEKAGMRLRGRRTCGEQGPTEELVSYEAILGLWSRPANVRGGGRETVALTRRAAVAELRGRPQGMRQRMTGVRSRVAAARIRAAGGPGVGLHTR